MRRERKLSGFRHDLCLSPKAWANFAYGETDTNPKKGMVINMKKFLKVILIVTSPIWLLAAYLIVNAIAYEKPVVKYAEFPFELTYEVNGNEITIDDIFVCKYDGLGCDEGNGFFRKWKGYIKGTGEERIVIYEVGGTTIFTSVANPAYLMGDKKYETPYEPRIYMEFEGSGNGKTTGLASEDLCEQYGIRITSWTCPEPIENEFKSFIPKWDK